jgi:starvation-inducible DNA-binding protein
MIASNSDRDICQALNSLVADCFALYLKTKSFHWHVSGPHFRDYHLMFDAQATQLLAMTDPAAERVRKLGGKTLRSIGHIARLQQLEDEDRDDVPASEMIVQLRDDNRSLLASLQSLKQAADVAGDNATSAFVDSWMDEAQQRIWFLDATLAR